MAGGVESYSWAVSRAFTRICKQVALLTASTSGDLPTENATKTHHLLARQITILAPFAFCDAVTITAY